MGRNSDLIQTEAVNDYVLFSLTVMALAALNRTLLSREVNLILSALPLFRLEDSLQIPSQLIRYFVIRRCLGAGKVRVSGNLRSETSICN